VGVPYEYIWLFTPKPPKGGLNAFGSIRAGFIDPNPIVIRTPRGIVVNLRILKTV
jgi:hypothetical protein